jgi:hypothetical protein
MKKDSWAMPVKYWWTFLCLIILLTANTIYASYPEPVIESASIRSEKASDGSYETVMVAVLTGPSPEDVTHFTVTGPGGFFTLEAGRSSRQSGLFYIHVHPGVLFDGNYVFEATDGQGRTALVTRSFTFDDTMGTIDSATLTPTDGAYVGTTIPTLGFSPLPDGGVYYQVEVWDYNGHALWYLSPISENTSITVPEGLLQSETPYEWVVRIWDSNTAPGNLTKSESRHFYTGVAGLPDVSSRFSFSLTDGTEYGHVFGVSETGLAPWDVTRLHVAGPEASPFVDVALDSLDCRFATPALYYHYMSLAGPLPDGVYAFELLDAAQNLAAGSLDFVSANIPTVSEASRLPEDNHYFDTRTPTFSWDPVGGAGPHYYKIEILGYGGEPEWYISPWSQDTSVTVPDGILLRGNSYLWQMWVADGDDTVTPINNMSMSSEWTFTINALPPLLISAPDLTGADFFVAHKTIDIDGDYSDWDVTDRIYLDQGGADCGDVPGRDIREVYVAQDNTYLYLRYVLNGALDDTFGYKFGDNFHVVIRLDNGVPEMFYAIPGQGGVDVQGGALHIDGGQFECMLPKIDLMDWQRRELSAWCDQGEETVCRDHVTLPDMNLDMAGEYVELRLGEGQTKTVYVSGGAGVYGVNSTDIQIASATVIDTTINVLGVSEGTATINVSDGEKTVHIAVTVVRAGRIAGTVLDNQGIPVPDQWISVSSYTNHDVYEMAMSQADGTYIVYGLPTGHYRVAARDQGANYVPEYFDGTGDYDSAFPVAVTEDQTTTGIDFSLDRYATISGYITSTGGAPLPGVKVFAFTTPCWDNCLNVPDFSMLDESITDENGHYTIVLPPVHAYVFACANCEGLNYINEWWDSVQGTGNCRDAIPVKNVPGGLTSDIDFSLEPGRMVSGTVTTTLGDSLEEVEILISGSPCFESYLGKADTDLNGDYTILGIPPGEVYVFADATSEDLNYVNEWWNGAQGEPDCSLAAPLTVPSDQDIADVDFELVDGVFVTGRITTTDNQPLAGVGVGAFLGDCQEGDPCRKNFLSGTDSDENGYYLIQGLPQDYVYVGAIPYKKDLHYVGRWWDGINGTVDCSASLPLDLSQGDASAVDFSLDQEGVVFGRVTDPAGNPLPGILMQAYLYQCGDYYLSSAYSNHDGYYIIPGLPPENVYVAACAHCEGFDYVTQWWDSAGGSFTCEGALAVTIQPDTITKGIDFSLEGGGSISGRVTTSEGRPIAGAEITAFSETCYRGDFHNTDITDEDGYYTISSLSERSFYVQAVSSTSGVSYVSEWWDTGEGTTNCNAATGVAVAAGQNTTAVDFVLEEGGGIAGRVTTGGGSPVENVIVRVFSDLCGKNRVGQGVSDANGDYSISGLAAGNVYAWACPECSNVDYVGEWWNTLEGTSDCNGAVSVAVTKGGTTGNIDFSLVQKGAIVLTPGVSYEGSVDPQQTAYFSVVPEAGRSLLVEVMPQSGVNTVILDGTLGGIPPYPGTGTYSTRNTTPRGNYEILISPAASGTYYVSLFGYRVDAMGGAYSIVARYLDEQYLSNISTTSGSNSGAVTFALAGVGFSEDTLVSLSGTGLPNVTPSQVVVVSSTQLYVTFDLTGVATGVYDVQIEKTGETASVLTSAFEVTAGTSGHLQVNAIAPEVVRPNRTYTFWLEYENDGGADMPAPLFVVSNNVNAKMSLYKNGFFREGAVQVLGVSSGGLSGVLLKGSHNRIPIYYKVPEGLTGHSFVRFSVKKLVAGSRPVDWQWIESTLKPDDVDPEAWSVIWSNFLDQFNGDKWQDYLERLGADASYLGLYGKTKKATLADGRISLTAIRDPKIYDVGALLQFEIDKASGHISPRTTLDSNIDVLFPAPGLPLLFSRLYQTPSRNVSTSGHSAAAGPIYMSMPPAFQAMVTFTFWAPVEAIVFSFIKEMVTRPWQGTTAV